MANVTIDWEAPTVPTGTLVTDPLIPAAGYGTWTSHGFGADPFTHDIQLASGWGSKSLRIVQGTVQRSMAGTVSTIFDSSINDVTLTCRVGTTDRCAITLNWDGLISLGFPPHPRNGITFQNRPIISETRCTLWTNGGFNVLGTNSYATANSNDFVMQCVVKTNGDLQLYIDGVLQFTFNDLTHTQGGFSFFGFALSPTYIDDIVVNQPPLIPDQVENLTVSATTASSVSLSWDAAAGATEYQIHRAPIDGTTVGTFTQINSATVTGTTYTDDAVNSLSAPVSGLNYAYKVRGAN